MRRVSIGVLAVALAACGDNTRFPAVDAPGVIDAAPPPVVRVLFVGNSYTAAHDLPGVLARLADTPASPVRFEVAMYAQGGWTWELHNETPEVHDRIREGWDFVVFQDQSQQPFVTPVKPALVELDATVDATGAQTVLYMTWAYQTFDPGGRFRHDMYANRYYQQHAEAVDAVVAPAG